MPNHIVSGDVDSMLRSANDAAIRSAIGVGQTDAPTFLAQTLTGQSLTGTQATSLVDLSTTWNTGGTPTALKLNVTNTSSNPASLLMDLQVGLVSKASITKGGQIASGFGFTYAQPHFYDSTFGISSGFQIVSSQGVAVYGGNSAIWGVDNGAAIGMRLSSHIPLGWTSSHALSNNPDVALFRDAAGILAQRNTTNTQAFRVYNTYTDASNYERVSIGQSAGAFRILAENLGSGTTARQLQIGTNTFASLSFLTDATVKWQISAAGHFIAATHNTYDIGASGGVSCPRNIHVAGGIYPSGVIQWASSTTLLPVDGDGTLRISNLAGTDFARLQLGGVTNSFPAISRDGAGIKFTGAAAGSTSWIKVPAVVVASLPAAATAGVGARAFVNNALNPIFGNAVVGSGLSTVPVYSDGTNWNVG